MFNVYKRLVCSTRKNCFTSFCRSFILLRRNDGLTANSSAGVSQLPYVRLAGSTADLRSASVAADREMTRTSYINRRRDRWNVADVYGCSQFGLAIVLVLTQLLNNFVSQLAAIGMLSCIADN